MDTLNQFFQDFIPKDFNISRYFWFLAVGLGTALVLSILFRLIFGQGSSLNHSVSSAVAILCMYAVSVVIYSTGGSLEILLSPLPFVELSGDYLRIFPLLSSSFDAICAEALKLIVLAFLMNLLITWLPKGKNILSWYFFRFLSVVLALCLHYVINLLLVSVLPESFVETAPMVLLIVLLASLLLGGLKLITGGALALINPLLGIFYTFFFANIVGKQLSRAIFTTALLTALVYLLNSMGITAICVASVALIAYLPIIILALILWYIIGKLL